MTQTISPHAALIYIMVTMSAVDRSMSDRELQDIGNMVTFLPVFEGFSPEKLVQVSEECGAILQEEGGLEAVFGLAKESLPVRLRETAYAVAVEVAASDLTIEPEELRLLQILADTLELEKLTTAAIERGARARHAVI